MSRIPHRELLAYREEIKRSIFRQIHAKISASRAAGQTQKAIADRIDMDDGQLSKFLKGERDLRIETLSDVARALDCRILAKLEPLRSETRVSLTFAAADQVKDDDVPTVEGATRPAESVLRRAA
jgi:transcriptional regulator with XRE-family HTH domain